MTVDERVRVGSLNLRGIMDSRARPTVEADLTLTGGASGRGSAPRAIAPGRRERARGAEGRLGPWDDLWLPGELRRAVLDAAFDSQADFDHFLLAFDDTHGAGADVTVAVSLAFARANAARLGVPLVGYLAGAARTGMPRLLVNVFSGGIHVPGRTDGFQQVMAIPRTGGLVDDIALACRVYDEAAALARERFGEPHLSASSGMLVPAGSGEQVGLLRTAIVRAGAGGACTVGVDVAAEHLRTSRGRYHLDGRHLDAGALAGRLAELADHPIALEYLEDPFDPADTQAWRELPSLLPAATVVVGDDLFATDRARIDRGLAGGVLLKLTQAGTVTHTVEAAAVARAAGMALAVSHRSGETEDAGMCDLAVALAAEFIKIGGPRRGDRLAKYNQLLRLAEHRPGRPIPTEVEESAPCPVPASSKK
jgi:enolase